MIKVAVSGFMGRMGAHVVEAVSGADDMEYVGGADPALPLEFAETPVKVETVSRLLELVKPDVVVEFSVPSAVMANSLRILEEGIPLVIGTTGITEEQRHQLGAVAQKNDTGVLVAPNFAIGAVLMMQFAKQAAPYFKGIEIIELHHDQKVDSPSGTALMTAGLINSAKTDAVAPAGLGQAARGENAGTVQVHSVRLPGLVAHQEVLMGNHGEGLTIRHDSYDRKSFMPGVLLGIRRITEQKGLVFGLENFLFS